MQLEHLETRHFASLLQSFAQDRTTGALEAKAFKRIAILLQRPLRIGLIGERRAGKSTLLNILVGAEVFPGKTLGRPCLLHVRYGEYVEIHKVNSAGLREKLTQESFRIAIADNELDQAQRSKVIYRARASSNAVAPNRLGTEKRDDYFEICLPLSLLQEVEIIEIPIDALTGPVSRPLFRVDLAVWVSHAAQAWKHSEFRAWSEGKYAAPDRSLLVVTNGEALSSIDKTRLMTRLKNETADLFAERYVVSSKNAESLLLTRQNIAKAAWTETGFYHLEGAIQDLVISLRLERLARARELCKRLELELFQQGHALSERISSSDNALTYEAGIQ